MRERGFLVGETITAKTIIDSKKISGLVAASPTETVASVFKKMKELHITQLPVMEGDKNLGSITEHNILHLLIDNPDHRDVEVGKVMKKPFPMVHLNDSAADISKHISRDNTAVLVKANSGATHIITEFDLIEVMA